MSASRTAGRHCSSEFERGQIGRIETRFRGGFAYIDATLTDGDTLKLCRLRYGGSAIKGASPFTEPATTPTKTPTSPAATPSAPAKKPSTPPAASTWATRPPDLKPPDERARPLAADLGGIDTVSA